MASHAGQLLGDVRSQLKQVCLARCEGAEPVILMAPPYPRGTPSPPRSDARRKIFAPSSHPAAPYAKCPCGEASAEDSTHHWIKDGAPATILEWTVQKQNTPDAFASGVLVFVVAGTGNDQNLRSPQVEAVAGGRNHLNLRQQKGRPVVAADLCDLASLFEIIAGMSNRLNLLFRAAA
jgi:hypothetical protein